MTTERLTIVVDERGARVVQGSITGIGTAAKGAGRDVNFLKTALASVATIAGVRTVIGLADAYSTLQNRLRLVTTGAGNLATVQEQLFDLARRTRSDITATVELYSRMARSSEKLGLSQKELIDITEAVNQAVKISGATGAEASAGLIQFAQGLASGALRGDELRSVLEQLPRLASAIAAGIDIDLGKLRELGQEGKLTALSVINAIKDQAGVLGKEFENITPTISDAFTILRNEAIRFIGELNEATGAGAAFATLLLLLADNLKAVGVAASAALVPLLAMGGRAVITGILALNAAILANPIVAVVAAITAGVTAMIAFGDQVTITSDGVVNLRDVVFATFTVISDWVVTTAINLQAAFTTALANIGLTWDDVVEAMAVGFNHILAFGKFSVNTQLGLWVGLKDSVLAVWDKFPEALANIMVTAANKVVGAVETIINKVVTAINFVLRVANAAATAVGQDPLFELFEPLVLGRITDRNTGAAAELGNALATAFGNALSRDYVGEFTTAVLDTARTIATQRIGEIEAAPLNPAPSGGGGPSDVGRLQDWSDLIKGLRKGLREYMTEINDFAANAENAVVNSFRAMEDALVEFVTTGKFNFKDLVDTVVQEITRLAIQMAVLRPILGAFGITPIAAANGAANGAIMRSGDLQTFATGGIVSSPTLFPTRTGIGLMGEAGPEAIMPLALTSSGRLGVETTGSGGIVFAPQISVTMPNAMNGGAQNAAQGKRIGEQINREIEAKFNELLAKHRRTGGTLNRGRTI